MIEAIIEVWCSPSRQEIYSTKMIPLCAGEIFNVKDDIDDYISWHSDFFYDAFGEDYENQKGLWKVVFKLNISYSNYYTYDGPDYDVNLNYEEFFKGKCTSWVEMKYVWLELCGKAEEYLNKPWKRYLEAYDNFFDDLGPDVEYSVQLKMSLKGGGVYEEHNIVG